MTSPRHVPSGDKICATCHKTHPWPDGQMPRHQFNGGSTTFDSLVPPAKPIEVKQSPWPFDPVLRQALINKGVLTPQDLTDAEAQIRAVTAQWEAGNDTGGTFSRS